MQHKGRFYFLLVILVAVLGGLLWRISDLSIADRPFLLKQGHARTLRIVDIPAYRGMIKDRNDVPLAVSTPVDAVWVNPQMFTASAQQLTQLASLINISKKDINKKIKQNAKKEFIYLARGLPPHVATQIKDLKISGLFFQREYRRYYPAGEVAAQVIGFTNVDDNGQEGLELAYNDWLKGVLGKRRVIKDRLGRTVADIQVVKPPQQGKDLTLSIDSRIQYQAYLALKEAVPKFNADAGTIIVLDVQTGEILAMVNSPSFNPNERTNATHDRYRNRALTDLFEPGSTMKTFSIAAALSTGKYTANTLIDTRPGTITIDGHLISDHGNYGILSVTEVLQHSSNIGVLKMALSLPADNLYNFLVKLGFGQSTQSGFPGEAQGVLVRERLKRASNLATLSYGYGLSVNALQLTQAYAAIAGKGIKRPVSFLKQPEAPKGTRVMDEKLAEKMLVMLRAVAEGGGGTAAQVPGYQVGGKTGTAYIAGPKGYEKDRYVSSFIGVAPLSKPRLVVTVILRGVKGNMHFGAQTSAPIFSRVMAAALRFTNVPPDKLTAQLPTPPVLEE